MTKSALAHMVGCNTAAEIWRALEGVFGTRCKAKIIQLKFPLQSQKKGGLSMKEYLTKMKTLVDTLASIRCCMSEDDHILDILIGWSNMIQLCL